MRRWIGLTIAAVGMAGGLFVSNELFVGWHPRFGIEALFQEVIRDANVAERYAGSHDRQVEDVTDKVCGRVDAKVLNGLGIPVDDRTTWPRETARGPKPADVWIIYEDKGGLAAFQDGLRHLQIDIDRITLTCSAEVKIWHAGWAL